MANIKEYLVLLFIFIFIFILPVTDSLFSEFFILLSHPASVENVNTQSENFIDQNMKDLQLPVQPQKKSTLVDYNINDLLADPVIKNAVTMTKQKKRYMIVHKNGEVEHVDSLEEVKNKHSNFKIVTKDNINKAIAAQSNQNNLIENNQHHTFNINTKSNQLQSNSISTSKSGANLEMKSTIPKKHYKVMHQNGTIEYIESLENVRQKYANFVLLDKKELIDELNRRILPNLIKQNEHTLPTNMNEKSAKTSTIASVSNVKEENRIADVTPTLQVSTKLTKNHETLPQRTPLRTSSVETMRFQELKGPETQTANENPLNSCKYELVGLPNIENIERALEESKRTRVDKKLRIVKNSNEIKHLRAVISPPSTSLLLQKLIHEDNESMTKLKGKHEFPVIRFTDLNTTITTGSNVNETNNQPVNEVTSTFLKGQEYQNPQYSNYKNKRVLTEAEMAEWASSFMSLPYSSITVQMTPRQLDIDPNGTIAISINV